MYFIIFMNLNVTVLNANPLSTRLRILYSKEKTKLKIIRLQLLCNY